MVQQIFQGPFSLVFISLWCSSFCSYCNVKRWTGCQMHWVTVAVVFSVWFLSMPTLTLFIRDKKDERILNQFYIFVILLRTGFPQCLHNNEGTWHPLKHCLLATCFSGSPLIRTCILKDKRTNLEETFKIWLWFSPRSFASKETYE